MLADLSNRYHVCDSCGFEIERDKGSALVMYQTALSRQPGLQFPQKKWAGAPQEIFSSKKFLGDPGQAYYREMPNTPRVNLF